MRWCTWQSGYEFLVVCGTDVAAEGKDEKLKRRLVNSHARCGWCVQRARSLASS